MFAILNGVLYANTFFLGLKSDLFDLTGVSLGSITISMIILSIDLGIIDAMSVLVAEAHGKKDYQAWGDYLNLGRYALIILALPQFLIFLFLEYIYE